MKRVKFNNLTFLRESTMKKNFLLVLLLLAGICLTPACHKTCTKKSKPKTEKRSKKKTKKKREKKKKESKKKTRKPRKKKKTSIEPMEQDIKIIE